MANIRTVAATAMAIACLSSAVPVSAERATVSGRIDVTDLNLGTAAGQAAFHQRVRLATEIACGDTSRVADMMADLARCQAKMRQDGENQLAARLGNPERSRVTVGSDAASQ